MPFNRAEKLASVDAEPLDEAALPPLSELSRAQVGSLGTVRASLQAEAKAYALQLAELAALGWRAQRAGPAVAADGPGGSWHISQWTAERWLSEAERFTGALPRTLAMLGEGRLLKHQAIAVRQELQACTAEIASAVEAEVLPAGAELCPTDLRRELKRVRLRLEREQQTAEQAEAQEKAKVGRRRTWTRPTEDDLMLADAVLTPEQGVAWAQGMDALERRERLADKAAGIDRTAEQRRADLFASLPAIVLAGLATDDRWRARAGIGGGRTPLTAPAGGTLFDADGPVPPPWALTPEQIAAQISLNIHVPVSTILDLSHEPGTLATRTLARPAQGRPPRPATTPTIDAVRDRADGQRRRHRPPAQRPDPTKPTRRPRLHPSRPGTGTTTTRRSDSGRTLSVPPKSRVLVKAAIGGQFRPSLLVLLDKAFGSVEMQQDQQGGPEPTRDIGGARDCCALGRATRRSGAGTPKHSLCDPSALPHLGGSRTVLSLLTIPGTDGDHRSGSAVLRQALADRMAPIAPTSNRSTAGCPPIGSATGS